MDWKGSFGTIAGNCWRILMGSGTDGDEQITDSLRFEKMVKY